MLQFGTKFTQAVTGTAKRKTEVQQRSKTFLSHTHTHLHPPVSDLGAAIEAEQLNISAVLGKRSTRDKQILKT